jgi:hypothetical protein
VEQSLYREGIRIQSLAGFFRLHDRRFQATGHKAQKIRVTGYLMWGDDHNGSADAGSTIQYFGTNGSSSVALDGMENSPDNKNRGNRVKSQSLNSPDDSTGSKVSLAISTSLPGPDFMRYYPVHRLIAWQPQGTLDDLMLDQVANWLVDIEKVFPPFKRFIDFSQLTNVAVRSGHVFKVARRRAQQFTGVEPVRTALFSGGWVAFGIACFYESLMEDTLIEARAFYDLAKAADWLTIPVDVLTLKDKPAPAES